MMPFFGMGGDHRADSWFGEPGTADTDKVNGDDGTANERCQIQFYCFVSNSLADMCFSKVFCDKQM